MTLLAAALTRPDDSRGCLGYCSSGGGAHIRTADESDDCHLDFSIFFRRNALYFSFLYEKKSLIGDVGGKGSTPAITKLEVIKKNSFINLRVQIDLENYSLNEKLWVWGVVTAF